MARSATSPAARLDRLRKGLEKATADGFLTETLTFEPMMRLVGVSRVTLRDWCNQIDGFEDSGCFERGAEGIEWAFNPVATLWFLIRHFEMERDQRVEKARRAREIAGGEALADVPEDFDLDQTRKLVQLARDMREEKQAQGHLVDAAKVGAAIDQMVQRMQQAGLQAAREQDPTNQWPPEIAESFEHAVNNLILALGEAAEDCLTAIRGGTA